MKKVLILSRSCGSGIGHDKVIESFREAGVWAEYGDLQKAYESAYDGIIVGMDPIIGQLFDNAPQLKVVMKYGVGTENIDIQAARSHGIRVLNMPGINSEAVAETAFALMLCTARRIAEGDRKVRAGEWPRLPGYSLYRKTLGIVGTGAIGTALAGISKGFDMDIIGSDPVQNNSFKNAGGQYVSFEELLSRSDFISIHAPLTESTRNMFSNRQFGMMKPSSILINTARGPIVDEDALYRALSDGRIAAAGLDVFEKEPLGESPLLVLDNVVCLPHIAAFSQETIERMDITCVKMMSEAVLQSG